ncbi:MAG TPA: hypothetical protein DHU93_06550, partial [Algoriphagus sp.]|nr:hypothetical protein [Algoriphagus sp.]
MIVGLPSLFILIFFRKKIKSMLTKYMKPLAGLFLCLISGIGVFAQTGRFQQAVDYQMEVSMDVKTNRYTGTQVLTYTNNSPDTLNRVFY